MVRPGITLSVMSISSGRSKLYVIKMTFRVKIIY